MLVAQDRREVTVFRRSADWQSETLKLEEHSPRLTSLDFMMPLPAVYEGVKL